MDRRRPVKPRRPLDGPTSLDLIEEATHLVRGAPLNAAATYMLGVVPFLLGAVFFIADMSRGAHAAARLPGAALGLTAAFAWMKAWQAVAAEQVLAQLEQRDPVPLGINAWVRLALRQFAVQAFALVMLPLAALFLVPLGWVYAYYQNVTVLGLREGARTHRISVEQARLWPAQNHGALSALSVLAILVLGNVGVALYVAPWLLRTLTGTDQVFAQTGWNPLNTTFLAAACALSFLVLDPVVKAMYVLRCFYGRSRRTGVDLLVQVRGVVGRAALVAGVGFVAFIFVGKPVILCAGESPGSTEAGVLPETPFTTASTGVGVDPEALDGAIERVLQQPDYVWREPAPKAEGAMSDLARWLRDVSRSINRWLRDLFDSERDEPDGTSRGLLSMSGSMLMWIVLLAAAGLLVAVIVSIVRRSGISRAGTASAPAVAAVALESHDITADQLAEEEWMRLARALIARGEARLGMRALFLGSLASLAAQGLLVLARHKSNRDYERELSRRGAPLRERVAAYTENRRDFEGVWYGDRVPDPVVLDRFEMNVRRLVHKEPL